MTEPVRVWIVDDDRSVRFVLAAALGEAGFRVSAFADAADLAAWIEAAERRGTAHDLADHPAWPVVRGLTVDELTPEEVQRYDVVGVPELVAALAHAPEPLRLKHAHPQSAHLPPEYGGAGFRQAAFTEVKDFFDNPNANRENASNHFLVMQANLYVTQVSAVLPISLPSVLFPFPPFLYPPFLCPSPRPVLPVAAALHYRLPPSTTAHRPVLPFPAAAADDRTPPLPVTVRRH